jgi:hypothetical protein
MFRRGLAACALISLCCSGGSSRPGPAVTDPSRWWPDAAPDGPAPSTSTEEVGPVLPGAALYFTDPARGGGVFRSTRDGQDARQILSFGDNAGAIASDETHLYYSGYGVAGVWRANLDGTDARQIVASIYPAWASP